VLGVNLYELVVHIKALAFGLRLEHLEVFGGELASG
jgi:hypothetical protein